MLYIMILICIVYNILFLLHAVIDRDGTGHSNERRPATRRDGRSSIAVNYAEKKNGYTYILTYVCTYICNMYVVIDAGRSFDTDTFANYVFLNIQPVYNFIFFFYIFFTFLQKFFTLLFYFNYFKLFILFFAFLRVILVKFQLARDQRFF